MMTSSSSFFAAGGSAAAAVTGEETGAGSFGFAEGDNGTPAAGLVVDAPTVTVTDRGDPTGDFEASAAAAPVPFCAPAADPLAVAAVAAVRGVVTGDFGVTDGFLEEETGDVGVGREREDGFADDAVAAGRGEFDELVAAAAAVAGFFAAATGLFGVDDAAVATAGAVEEALAPVKAVAGAAAGGEIELAALGAAPTEVAVAAEGLAEADAAGAVVAATVMDGEGAAGLVLRAATA
jgi:hypothetical protein